MGPRIEKIDPLFEVRKPSRMGGFNVVLGTEKKNLATSYYGTVVERKARSTCTVHGTVT